MILGTRADLALASPPRHLRDMTLILLRLNFAGVVEVAGVG